MALRMFRRVQEYLHPFSEHLIDWFSHHHAADGVCSSRQKALQEERPQTGR